MEDIKMSKFRVAIVGAGASGIAAASRLLEGGIEDIILLEAEDRIGGRIHTCEFGESEIDMGAQWVHGEKNNVVYSLAKPYNLLEESSSRYPDTQFVTSKGEFLCNQLSDELLTLLAQINESAVKDLIGFHGSLGEYFTKEFDKKLQLADQGRPLDKKLAKSFLEWYHKFENSIDASESWFETSGKGHIEYWECEGNPLLSWKKGGYLSVFDLLMGKYPDPKNELPVRSKIELKKEVTSIHWDGLKDKERQNKVSVICADGSEYIADHLILTVSLGVLLERLNMFHPELPRKKCNAIKGLAIGTVDKIFMRYHHRWWPQNCAGFSFVWDQDDEIAFKKELIKNEMEGKDWLLDVFGFYSVDNHPLILCGWIVGSSAKAMEQLSNEEVADSCHFLLNFFLSRHYSIPACEEVKKSTWNSNPHFRGSYSYRSMDTEKMGTSAEHLSCPLHNENGSPVLLFAGEATHPHYFSTVHGAIESGWREADRLIKSLRCENKNLENYGLKNYSKECQEHDVVILGAGIAGIAAAKTLLNGGIKSMAILEAQGYAGGRILSLPFKEKFIELGAQWIHGEENEVCKLAQNYGLISNISSVEGEGVYLREDGSVVSSELVKEVRDIVDEILDDCESFARNKGSFFSFPSSVGQHLKQKFGNYLDDCRQSEESEKLISIKEELYDWHLRFQIIDNSCLKLENLSAKAWGNYAICDGSDHINFHSGYTTLIEKLLCEIDSPKILHLNCPVKEVIWLPNVQASLNKPSHDNDTAFDSCIENLPVRLVCEDGQEFAAKHAIITCSLGYLKENHKKMFTPPLPKKTQDAIEDMGFATINKIFLDYGEPWWEPHVKGFQLLWSKKAGNLSSLNKENWIRDLSGFDVLPNHIGVLLGWVGSFGAEIVEEIPEDEIGRQCTNILKKFTKREDIPPPKKVIRSKWFSNPYVRGSYSHTTSLCDNSGSSPAILSEPIYSKLSEGGWHETAMFPTLLFAGEATHNCFFSTTHGAYESGKDQAKLLLSQLT